MSKSVVTVLAYKKGDAGNQENFHPITLQYVPSKIFTSIILNRTSSFALTKQIHWNVSWKRFLGENIRLYRAYQIFIAYHKHCKIEAKGFCCICVRFKECFWRGKHNFLIESLKILQMPAVIIQLITSLHSDYDISILTDNFMTSPIKFLLVYHLYSSTWQSIF